MTDTTTRTQRTRNTGRRDPARIVIRPGDSAGLIGFLKSTRFGAFLLICSTILEGFYAFRLFRHTGGDTFGGLLLPVSLIYATLVTGVIVFFALRNNRMIVWLAVGFEFAMNFLLDVQTVAIPAPENWQWIFASQLAIGTILPLATKAFADEVNKRVISRERRITGEG